MSIMKTTRDHLKEILSMLDLGFTLEQVGCKFGVSRQRISQLVGKIESLRKRKINMLSLYDTANMTNSELSALIGGKSSSIVSSYRNGERHAVKQNCTVFTGHYWEEKVIKKIMDIGLCAAGQEYKSPFDILVNNKIKIDVKAACVRYNPPTTSCTSPAYRFRLRDKIKDQIDFYVFAIAESEDYFIVPSTIIPANQTDIIFVWPSKRPEIGRYQKYHDRWDLIFEAIRNMNKTN